MFISLSCSINHFSKKRKNYAESTFVKTSGTVIRDMGKIGQ